MSYSGFYEDKLNYDKLIEEIILGEQFIKKQKEKESLLLHIFKWQLNQNRKNPNLNSLYDKLSLNTKEIKKLEEVPFIPVDIFKRFELRTCDKEEVIRILNSSSTTSGVPSKIYIDKKTSIRQTQALISTLKNFLGGSRRPLLIIDTEDTNKKSETLSARGAAIRGISNFGRNITYVMDKIEGGLELNIKKLKEFEEKYKNEEVLIYGFTYIVWSRFINALKKHNIKLNIPKLKLLHSGGWKQLTNERVEKEEFNNVTAEILGTNPKNIIDFYGMAEQVGVVFLDCECGHKHVADFADVLIRDINTLEEVAIGETGVIEVKSVLGASYPSQGILTEDVGQLIGIDNCPCGRNGKYFKFKSRLEKSETRGCGDTFAEKENRL